MSSFGKNSRKNNSFKEGNNPLFPISNKNNNLYNYNNALKININADILKNNNKKLNSNISTNLQHKIFVENSPVNSKIKISKNKQLDFSSNISDNKLIDIYGKGKSKSKSNKKKYLSSNKTNINLMPNTTRNNYNIISSKNILATPQKINNNKNSLRKKNIEIFDSNNNSYFKKINKFYNNSSTDINKIAASNLINQKTNLYSNIKLRTDVNYTGLNSPKEGNIKLLFRNKNDNNGKNNNLDLPITLKRKDSSLPLAYTNPGNNMKYSIDKNIFDSEYKLYLKRPKKNASNENSGINLNLNNFVEGKNIKNLDNNTKKNKKIKKICPEDLHFYYILVIQEGKKNETQMEKD